jgi:hypothetical protein
MRAGPAVSTTTLAVGDEDDSLLAFLPDPQQLQVHLLAGQRVQGAEGFVHQDQLGVVNERAGNGGALLHAPGQFIGIFVLGTAESHHVQQAACPLAARLHRQAEDFGGQHHVVQDAPPLQQQRLLEHHADVAPGIEFHAVAADPDGPALVRVQPGHDLQ